jgi:hypothetical protein
MVNPITTAILIHPYNILKNSEVIIVKELDKRDKDILNTLNNSPDKCFSLKELIPHYKNETLGGQESDYADIKHRLTYLIGQKFVMTLTRGQEILYYAPKHKL